MMIRKIFPYLLFSFFMLFLVSCYPKKPPPRVESTLTVSTENDPQSLDPRQVRDLGTTTVIHMLYEGLMRLQEGGQVVPALAESVTISPDQKTYTFKLRRSGWSDGQLVTAYDFESTWKSVLHPDFPSANAYQLYVIKGAQSAKECRSCVEHIGVQALDASTLVVELERPIPYFLRLTAAHFFYPVHPSMRLNSIDSQASHNVQLVTNGPFKLEKWSRHNELTAVPQPYYWDRKSVHLDRVTLVVLDNATALQLFHQGELQWTGSPLSTLPIDALTPLNKQGKLEVNPATGLYFIRLNTANPPFNQVKIRQAFAYALQRADLIEHVLQGNQQVALGLIPPSLLKSAPHFRDAQTEQAKKLFQESLAENHLTVADLPKISLCYASSERGHKIAQVAQQQWKEVLGVQVDLESCESKVYFDRLNEKNYQMGIGGWFADIYDPISFLDVFKSKDNGTNNTEWENQEYTSLIERSLDSSQPAERIQLIKSAEQILVQEMPIIPLFYASYNYLKSPTIKNVHFSELGYLDFKHAYFEGQYLQTTID